MSFLSLDCRFAKSVVAQIPTAGKLYLYFYPSPEVAFKPGPFNLGKWGYAINVYAIAWYAQSIVVMALSDPVYTHSSGRFLKRGM